MSGAVRRFGKLYGLVNSAGIRGVGNVLDLDPEAWRRVLSVNLDGTFNVCQAFARLVKEAQTPAAIVNLSSAAGIRGVPNRLPYAASKYGVVGITQTMALKLGPLGVRVSPGGDHQIALGEQLAAKIGGEGTGDIKRKRVAVEQALAEQRCRQQRARLLR